MEILKTKLIDKLMEECKVKVQKEINNIMDNIIKNEDNIRNNEEYTDGLDVYDFHHLTRYILVLNLINDKDYIIDHFYDILTKEEIESETFITSQDEFLSDLCFATE